MLDTSEVSSVLADSGKLFLTERTLNELLTLITEHMQISQACHDSTLIDAVLDARNLMKFGWKR